MSSFQHIQNIHTRAIAPDYQSQWYDRVFSYPRAPSGTDYIIAGYPYSTGNLQVINSPHQLDGDTNEGAMLTIAGDPMNLISGSPMRRISA
jgi:hypothetical protein